MTKADLVFLNRMIDHEFASCEDQDKAEGIIYNVAHYLFGVTVEEWARELGWNPQALVDTLKRVGVKGA